MTKPPMPLDHLVAYLKRNEWQLPMLSENSRVTVNAMVVYSCLVYLDFVKLHLEEFWDEQAKRRERSNFPQARIGERSTGYEAPPDTQDGVGTRGAEAGYKTQSGVGTTSRVVGGGVGEVGSLRSGPRTAQSGAGSPDCEAFHPENHGGDRREGGKDDEARS